jgi:hypothetical protein
MQNVESHIYVKFCSCLIHLLPLLDYEHLIPYNVLFVGQAFDKHIFTLLKI